MRLATGTIFGLLAALSALPGTADPAPSMTCIGGTPSACLLLLTKAIPEQIPGDAEQQLERADQLDVAGRPLAPNGTTVTYAGQAGNFQGFPAWMPMVGFHVKNGIVDSVSVSLNMPPELGRTSETYDQTGLYEAMSTMIGISCPQMQRAELYKFFELQVKPKIKSQPVERHVDMSGASEEHFSMADPVPFCGYKVVYSHSAGINTDYISDTNPTGVYDLPNLDVKK